MLPVLELDPDECLRLLGAGIVGRFAVMTPEGPHVAPVTYSLLDDAVVFCVGAGGVAATRGPGALVGFEVDQVEYQWQHGWSVLVRGICEAVPDGAEANRIRRATARPWAFGPRDVVLRVPCTSVTGRKLGAGWDPVAEMAVHRAHLD